MAFKVQNLRSLDTGRGLTNVSTTDRQTWEEFGGQPEEAKRLASLIRAGIPLAANDPPVHDDGSIEFYEGRLITRRHLARERNPKVRPKLLDSRRANGLKCDVCNGTFDHLPDVLRDAAFEAHHVIPIAEVGEGPTKLKDVALLCATCHRLIHRLIASQRAWVGIEEARAMLSNPNQ